MGKFSCDGHEGLVKGQLAGVLCRLLVDGQAYSSYRRLCKECLPRLLGAHHRDWLPSLGAAIDETYTSCFNCGVVAETFAHLRPFYVTLYRNGSERSHYHSMYCNDCADIVKHERALEVATNGSH